jgi:hypothetical protein
MKITLSETEILEAIMHYFSDQINGIHQFAPEFSIKLNDDETVEVMLTLDDTK